MILKDLEAIWRKRFESVKLFIQTSNRLPSSSSQDRAEKRLGGWLDSQKWKKRRGLLANDKIRKLQDFPDWSWNFQAEQWGKTRLKVRDFIDKYGCYPSKKSPNKAERSLAGWCIGQKSRKRLGTMPQLRIKLLEQLPGWQWDRFYSWEELHDFLRTYVSLYGTYPYTLSPDAEERRLGNWVITQRMWCKTGKLTKKQIELLEEIPGWQWSVVLKWEDRYRELKAFVKAHGNYPNSHSPELEETSLGDWACKQRLAYHEGTLAIGRGELLEQLPGWRWKARTQWDENYEQVQAHLAAYQKYPNRYSKDTEAARLGEWIMRQRQHYKTNHLSTAQIILLSTLHGWQWEMLFTWDEQYERLKRFVQNNARYPNGRANDPEESKLAKWMHHQRIRCGKKELAEANVLLLEALPAWQWQERFKWDAIYEQVRVFVADNQKYPNRRSKDAWAVRLGNWVNDQKGIYNAKKLSEERIKLLEMLPGWQWRQSISFASKVTNELPTAKI